MKKNIQPMVPMVEKIMALNPCEYDWKVDDTHGYGFIAQEVHETFPEFRSLTDKCNQDLDEPKHIDTGEPIYYGLDYGKFTPYIIKAFQELKHDYDSKLVKMQAQIDFLLSKLSV